MNWNNLLISIILQMNWNNLLISIIKASASKIAQKPVTADNEILPSGLRKLSTEGKSSDEISNLLCGILTNHRSLGWNDMSVKTQVKNTS